MDNLSFLLELCESELFIWHYYYFQVCGTQIPTDDLWNCGADMKKKHKKIKRKFLSKNNCFLYKNILPIKKKVNKKFFLKIYTKSLIFILREVKTLYL